MSIKMTKKNIEEKLKIPEDINVRQENGLVFISGPAGETKKRLDNPKVRVEIKNNEIVLTSKRSSKKEKSMVNTYRAHLRNAINGAKEPYVYKLKICSGHFPMNVSVSNNFLIIKNFLGEKIPRKVEIRNGAKVRVEGDKIIVESADKNVAGQVAADIEQRTRRPGFDKRIFQDGIYIIEKAGKKI